MTEKEEMLKAMEYENEILEVIETQLRNDENSMTQSDLQGVITAIVLKIMRNK